LQIVFQEVYCISTLNRAECQISAGLNFELPRISVSTELCRLF
jgi:hypothetical protein